MDRQELETRSTRRQLVKRAAIAGGAIAGLAVLGPVAGASYSNALGEPSQFGVAGDVAKRTLLNSSHRAYFEAARNQEASHLAVLESLGLSFPYSTFAFPA